MQDPCETKEGRAMSPNNKKIGLTVLRIPLLILVALLVLLAIGIFIYTRA